MVATVSCKVKLDNSGLKEVLKAVEYLKNNVVRSGVLNADEETYIAAKLNVFGGKSRYDRGPYMGEEVDVPPRDFIGTPVKDETPTKVLNEVENPFNINGAISLLEKAGEKMSSEQKRALDTNGENVGWQKWQDFRTIATKGHDKPLHTWNMVTFPIDYKVVRKGA